MNEARTRYRGAQPFADELLSQRTFFGRDEAAVSLTNQILANRLVVVYAKSGLGKSSLLNAGVAPRLREAACQPLMVRVNDVQQGPLASVLNGIRAEAQRQGVEYVEGDRSSLWAFFKTVEFWRGDLLLQPVLVIDQFEELFTLHGEDARDELLDQLGHLVRGVPPALPAGAVPAYSDTPPALHLVLSLREDFLGILEDASDRIPQIMDHRFRLQPLSRQQAAEAMTAPAALDDAALATPPFALAPAFVDTVLDLLTAPAASGSAARRAVEPFHLQLICQRAEQMVAAAKGRFDASRPFGLADFGGDAALARTLTDFYTQAIQSLAEAHLRSAARRLCEEFLISPEGRRLSIEEHEIRKQLGLSDQALRQLVDARLLRTDRRSDSTYYELGHDALVEPVLATRRTRGLLFGWIGIVFGAIVTLIGVLLLVAGTAAILSKDSETDLMIGSTVLAVIAMALLLPVRIVRAGLRARRRFGRRAAQEPEAAPTLLPLRERWWCRALVGVGTSLLVFSCVMTALALSLALWAIAAGGQLPAQFNIADTAAAIAHHPVREIFWLFIELVPIGLFGARLRAIGRRRLGLAPPERPLAATASAHWLAAIDPKAARRWFSALAAAAALIVLGLVLDCSLFTGGAWPAWLSGSLVSFGYVEICTHVGGGTWAIDELINVLFIVSAFALALADWWPVAARLLRTASPATPDPASSRPELP